MPLLFRFQKYFFASKLETIFLKTIVKIYENRLTFLKWVCALFFIVLLIKKIIITTLDHALDEGLWPEDLDDPGYLADQGKQSFVHVWAYVMMHANVDRKSVV